MQKVAENHKAGFVNILGKPNVGKSTLMNALIEQRLSIISPKAQTTRHRILGIYNDEDHQVVFSDTPGIIKPVYGMQEAMMQFVKGAFEDADLFLLVTEAHENADPAEEIITRIKESGTPCIVVINKTDLSKPEAVAARLQVWSKLLPEATLIPVSAMTGHQIKALKKLVLEAIPKHPPFFPKDAVTDKPERFFVTEIIREKILLQYKQEIPYSCEVAVESFKEDETIIRIRAEIYVNRDSQKPIIIGKGGSKIKGLGIASRRSLEKFFGKQIHIELFVKVKENWRDNDRFLKDFGYKG